MEGTGRHARAAVRHRWRTLPRNLIRLNRFQAAVLAASAVLVLAAVYLGTGLGPALAEARHGDCVLAPIVAVDRRPSRLVPGVLTIEYAIGGQARRARGWNFEGGPRPGDRIGICVVRDEPAAFAASDESFVSTPLLPYAEWYVPAVFGVLGFAVVLSTAVVQWRESEEYHAGAMTRARTRPR